jgi:hypothetical protein
MDENKMIKNLANDSNIRSDGSKNTNFNTTTITTTIIVVVIVIVLLFLLS